MFTLEKLNVDELFEILNSSYGGKTINKLPRSQILEYINHHPSSSLHIKFIQPVLTRDGINCITKKRDQQEALRCYLRHYKKATVEDYEFACGIDGSFLTNIPGGKRTSALCLKAIQSNQLPSFKSIPIKFRTSTNQVYKAFFEKMHELTLEHDQDVNWGIELPHVINAIGEIKAFEILRNQRYMSQKHLIEISQKVGNQFIRNAKILFQNNYNMWKFIPSLYNIEENGGKPLATTWYAAAEQGRFLISLPSDNWNKSFTAYNRTKTSELIANQSWFKVEDAVDVAIAIQNRQLSKQVWPQLEQFKTEIQVITI